MSKKRKKKICTKRSWIVDIPISVCIFFIVAGVLMGTVFMLNAWYFGKPIEKSEAISTSGTFHYFLRHSSKGSFTHASIHFTDRETLDIHGGCFNVDVEDALDTLEKGDKIEMLLHPISNDIWEMRSGDTTILSFEDAKDGMRVESIVWSVTLIPLCDLMAIIGVISICVQFAPRKKKK